MDMIEVVLWFIAAGLWFSATALFTIAYEIEKAVKALKKE